MSSSLRGLDPRNCGGANPRNLGDADVVSPAGPNVSHIFSMELRSRNFTGQLTCDRVCVCVHPTSHMSPALCTLHMLHSKIEPQEHTHHAAVG